MDDSPDSNSFEASLPDDPIAVTSAYLKHRGVKGTIIFAMLTGSQAYNLAHKDSDKDYLGAYSHALVFVCCNQLPSDTLRLWLLNLSRDLHRGYQGALGDRWRAWIPQSASFVAAQ